MARGGIEPPTYRFSGGRSYQLSYLAKPTKTEQPQPRPVRLTPSKPRWIRTIRTVGGMEGSALQHNGESGPCLRSPQTQDSHRSRDPDGTRTRDLRRDRATR